VDRLTQSACIVKYLKLLLTNILMILQLKAVVKTFSVEVTVVVCSVFEAKLFFKSYIN